MTISYPLSLPSSPSPKRMRWRTLSAVGFARSPFTLTGQVYEHAGAMWGPVEVILPPMQRADAEAWLAFALALNGRRGTFLMGPVESAPQGTWVSPVVSGSHAAGVKVLNVRGVDGLSWAAGDWFQVGSGSSAHLHKVTVSGAHAGSPSVAQVDFWPPLREALTDGVTVTLASPKGQWRMVGNEPEWDLGEALEYGFGFTCEEAL